MICERKWQSNLLSEGARAVRPWGGLWSRERTDRGAKRNPSKEGIFRGAVHATERCQDLFLVLVVVLGISFEYQE